jgi:hypothetical protein
MRVVAALIAIGLVAFANIAVAENFTPITGKVTQPTIRLSQDMICEHSCPGSSATARTRCVGGQVCNCYCANGPLPICTCKNR